MYFPFQLEFVKISFFLIGSIHEPSRLFSPQFSLPISTEERTWYFEMKTIYPWKHFYANILLAGNILIFARIFLKKQFTNWHFPKVNLILTLTLSHGHCLGWLEFVKVSMAEWQKGLLMYRWIFALTHFSPVSHFYIP